MEEMVLQTTNRPANGFRLRVMNPQQPACDEFEESHDVWICDCGAEVIVKYTKRNHMYAITHMSDTILLPFIQMAQKVKLGQSPVADWVEEIHERDRVDREPTPIRRARD